MMVLNRQHVLKQKQTHMTPKMVFVTILKTMLQRQIGMYSLAFVGSCVWG